MSNLYTFISPMLDSGAVLDLATPSMNSSNATKINKNPTLSHYA
jgi:hypothetical protein